ncbi:MAG TPA: dTDP-4-dehydrorhamnose 3,5-epimerase family protein [bacterium]|nr:dTDP-4-dehydrorhamnose 3,5-epimerase family protein [bacterium]HPQ65192.1 dTDP-4-dehydrorhamnose 3,5-epimerase family protein [bacterium]
MAGMEVRDTSLPGVKLIRPPTVSEDFRGGYTETYNRELYHRAGIAVEFVQDDYSFSYRHVLRGIHADDVTWKLVYCPFGRFYLVIVDCCEGSASFGRWESFTLSSENRLQVLSPPGHGVAHLVTSPEAVFGYKQSTYYDRKSQRTYRWDDPAFGIYWPVDKPILSPRDALARD